MGFDGAGDDAAQAAVKLARENREERDREGPSGREADPSDVEGSDAFRRAKSVAEGVRPAAALAQPWGRRFGAASTAFASGWMRLRGVRRRRAADRGFVVSDHVDWPDLMRTIRETEAEKIFVTHGYTDIFARHLTSEGWDAQVVPTEFGSDEDDGEPLAEATS